MVNGKWLGLNTAPYHLPFTIYHLPFTIYYSCSLTRCLNIDVDFLSSAAAKQTPPIDKEQDQDNDHEDRYNGDNARTSTAATIFSHEAVPPLELEFDIPGGLLCGGLRADCYHRLCAKVNSQHENEKETRAW